MAKLALHIIAKDEVEKVKQIVADYIEYFDEIAIAYDSDEFKAEDHGKIKWHRYEWCDDFAHKRNFLADKTDSEYYFRLDTDDEIVNPDAVRAVFDQMVQQKMDVVYLQYMYDSDADGNCSVTHWRETIIRKDGNHYWKKPVHENIYVEDQSVFKGVKDKRVAILHHPCEGHAEKSAKRNFEILLKEFKEDGSKTDTRTISYLGRMLLGWGKYEQAKYFLQLLVQQSGWSDDKYFGWIHLGHCHNQLGDTETAIACCNEAMALSTEYPDAYLSLCEIYIGKEEYQKAIDWGTLGISKEVPDTMFVLDPTKYSYRALINLGVAYFGLGDYEKAKACMDKAYKYAPTNDYIVKNKKMFDEAYEHDKFFKNLMWLLMFLKANDTDKITDLIKAVPNQLMKDERIQALRHKFLPAKKWGDKTIAFFCGNSAEEWSAPSVISGIGGSEEAVIYISQELSKLGYQCTVFNNCGDLAGKYSGVEYKPFYEFNPNDEYDIVIGWRRDIFNGKLKARKKVVWLHDVPQEGVIQKECNFDHILVLSEYHKTLLPGFVPEDKIVVSANGIHLKDFSVKAVPAREPYRMIYTSSYDRGIQHLLLMWKDIKKAVPEAELHLFYGWECYDKFMKMGYRSKDFRDKMTELMNQEGVVEHGRVGHRQLVKELQKSKFWVYPSHFEEISCISAMKAQACGCTPVVINYAALKETVKAGIKVEGQGGHTDTNERYKKALIKALKDGTSVTVDKKQFGWDKVARQWNSELFND